MQTNRPATSRQKKEKSEDVSATKRSRVAPKSKMPTVEVDGKKFERASKSFIEKAKLRAVTEKSPRNTRKSEKPVRTGKSTEKFGLTPAKKGSRTIGEKQSYRKDSNRYRKPIEAATENERFPEKPNRLKKVGKPVRAGKPTEKFGLTPIKKDSRASGAKQSFRKEIKRYRKPSESATDGERFTEKPKRPKSAPKRLVKRAERSATDTGSTPNGKPKKSFSGASGRKSNPMKKTSYRDYRKSGKGKKQI